MLVAGPTASQAVVVKVVWVAGRESHFIAGGSKTSDGTERDSTCGRWR